MRIGQAKVKAIKEDFDPLIAILNLSEERKDDQSCLSSSSSAVQVIDLDDPVPHSSEYRVLLKKSLQKFDAAQGQFKSVPDRDANEQNELPKQTIFKQKQSIDILDASVDCRLQCDVRE